MDKLVTLLVPTDFSAAAKAAARYAASMAAIVNARVILLSVVEMDTEEAVLHNWKTLENQLKRSSLRGLDKLMKEIQAAASKPIEITTDLMVGIPMEDVILQYAKEKKVDLIVMGTKGAKGLKKILSGSKTAHLIEHSSVPILAIPVKATFTQLKKMVYASDLKNVQGETRSLSRIAAYFGAEIMVLHIAPANSASRVDRSLEPALIEKSQYGAISFHQLQSDDVAKAIENFIGENKADILVMYTHELDFLERVMDMSVTRKMAFHTKVPLLVFNRSTVQG